MQVSEVFSESYERYYDYIYKYLLLRTGSREDLEDILQSVWLSYFQKLSSEGEGSVGNVKHYLLRCAKSALADHYRALKPHESIEETERDIVDERALRELENDDGFTAQRIMKMVRETDMVTYRIFVLHFQYGHTLKKTASLLKMDESTVKSRLYRELRRLKSKCGEANEHESV